MLRDTDEVAGKLRGTSIKACSCYHLWQDKTKGKGLRVHNRMLDNKWRCTVCGTQKG